MKMKVFSFFFFLPLCLFHGVFSFSQETATDSLNYYSTIADNPKNEHDLERAYVYFLKYYEASKNTGNFSPIFGLHRLSSIEYKLGLYVESENTVVEALALLDRLEPSPDREAYKISFYNLLGHIYHELQLNEKAHELYNLSLELAKKAEDSLVLYNNLGNSFLERNRYQEAKPYLLFAQELIPKVKDSAQIARVWANLGYVDCKLNNKTGFDLLLKALSLRKGLVDIEGTYNSYKLLSDYYSDQNEANTSKLYLDSAYATAKKLKSLAFEQDALKLMSLSGSPEVIKEYFVISDSLKRLNSENQNKFALLKYDAGKAKTEALENKLQAEKRKVNFITLLSISILATVLGTGFTIWLYFRDRRKRLIEVYNTESRISKKVHDEVANDVYHMMAKLQGQNQTTEELLDDLEHIYYKTRDISKENSIIDTETDFGETLNGLLQSFQNEHVNVIIRELSTVNWSALSELKKISLYKVLQELMINMRKHSKATLVALSFRQEGPKLLVNYTDNGQGCELKKENGLHNTENRIRSISGSITFESEPQKGFKAKIVI